MLSIRIISAQCLPKPPGAVIDQGDIIDPYVLVSVSGVPVDCQKVA